MEYERVTDTLGRNELWGYEWDITSKPPTKINRLCLGIEQPPSKVALNTHSTEAISWSYGRTLGDIATSNADVIRSFPGQSGENVLLACEIVPAGKFRNGKERWWCRTHQKHWGVQADFLDSKQTGVLRCAHYSQPMSYVVNPKQINLELHAEVGVWCSLPPAFTSAGITPSRHPRIHVHVRDYPNTDKILDADFNAVTLVFASERQLFGNTKLDRVHLSPPAAKEFLLALEYGAELTCFNCIDCGSPHLDLGEFATKPHAKHLCGNCGRDNTWSSSPSSSSPLKPLHDTFDKGYGFIDVGSVLDLDEYPGAEYAIWASTPAIVWTASRPEERGIHVHLGFNGNRIIDGTYGTVILRGLPLNRGALLRKMIDNTMNY
jgi:transposase-like protein